MAFNNADDNYPDNDNVLIDSNSVSIFPIPPQNSNYINHKNAYN